VKNFEGKDEQEMGPERKKEHDGQILRKLRDEIADTYWQIFLPEWDYHGTIDPRIEKLMSYLVYAISKHLDDFAGYEEEDDLIAEYEYVFRDDVLEAISNGDDLIRQDEIAFRQDQDVRMRLTSEEGDEEIPF